MIEEIDMCWMGNVKQYLRHFRSLFASISNHMANREKRLALMKENMAANALMGGIDPINHHLENNLTKRNTVKKENEKPKK